MTEFCPICLAGASRYLFEGYDDRYACPGNYPVYFCPSCGHGFIPTEYGPDSRQLYSRYYPRGSFNPEAFRPLDFSPGLKGWLTGEDSSPAKWVPQGVRLLDIGCGYGEALAYHRQRGCDARGAEIDDNVRLVAERYGLDICVGPFHPGNHPAEFFDVATLHQVIEHFDDPVEALCGVHTILRKGGVAILSTPNPKGWGARIFGRKWINWHLPYHRHFFSEASMTKAAMRAGFVVISARTVTPSAWLGYQWVHLLTFPPEGTLSAFWSPLGKRTLPVRAVQKGLEVLHLCRVNHLMTRFFDRLDCGDNWLFVLKKL